MKSVIIMLCLLGLGLPVFAQKHPYEVKFSYQIEKGIADGSIPLARAGLLYSLIGDYRRSIEYSDIPVSWGVDSIYLGDHNTKEALTAIVEAAKKHQIVVISENHLKPQHRVFAKKVIIELAAEGFRHLGLETFTHVSNDNSLHDLELRQRGYPLDSPLTGTFTLEPQMGDLVRRALEVGYEPFAYERVKKIEGKDRDEILADNIISYLERNEDSKFVIVCGFHHAIESDIKKRGRFFWMAKYLKEKLGIDPLTIYQDNFTEKIIEDEHPFLSHMSLEESSVFIDHTGELLQLSPQVDLEVIHPKTTFRGGRPSWLFESEDHRLVPIKTDEAEMSFPILASVYPISEVGGVPLDRLELKHRQDTKKFVLKPGSYRVTLHDGERTFSYETTIE